MINRHWNGSNVEGEGRAVICRVHPIFSCSCGIQSRKLQDSRSQSADLILDPSAPAMKLNCVIHLSTVASVYNLQPPKVTVYNYNTCIIFHRTAVSPHELRQRIKIRLNGFLAHRSQFVIDDHPIPNVQVVTHTVKASEVRR